MAAAAGPTDGSREASTTTARAGGARDAGHADGARGSWRGTDTAIVAVALTVGLCWSFAWEVYDVRSPGVRVALTALSMVCSFALLWVGLALARVPRGARAPAAAWALLPWNGVLFGQLAYVGHVFVVVEVVASAYLLHRRASVALPRALFVAAVVRVIVLVTIAAAAAAARGHLAR